MPRRRPQYFNKHERSPVHIAAVVLNPQLKCKVTQESKEAVKRKAEKTLSRLWKNEYRSNTGFLQRVTPTPTNKVHPTGAKRLAEAAAIATSFKSDSDIIPHPEPIAMSRGSNGNVGRDEDVADHIIRMRS